MNPYSGADFFQFFGILIQRLFTGQIFSPAADEVQLAVLCAVSVSCGLIGPFLVLRRMAMFANSLSHTILFGIAGAFLVASKVWTGGLFDLPTLLLGAFIAALVTAFLTEGLVRLFRLQEDASVGLVFTALFALGIVLVTLFTRDVHLGTEAVMGNVDILQISDIRFAALLAAVNLGAVVLFYPSLLLSSFDGGLAKTLGVKSRRFLLLFLTAITCIGAFRAVGVLLVLAFLTGPYLTARLFCHRLPWLLFWSCAIGCAASAAGVALSRHLLSVYGLALSTGGIVVSLAGAIFAAALLLKWALSGKLSLFGKRQAPCAKESPS